MGYPDAYCVKCGKHTETQQKHTVLLQNSARALKGVCPDCATEVYKILPKTKPFKTTVDREEAAARKVYPHAYCVRCQEHTPTVRPHTLFLENGSRAMTGACSKCNAEVYRILGHKRLKTEQQPRREGKAKAAEGERRVALTRRAEPVRGKAPLAKYFAISVIVGMVAGFVAYALL